MNNKKIILASRSLIRQQLLEKAGIDFEVQPADINEQSLKESNSEQVYTELALLLASAKAESISEQSRESYVIGCDTLCVSQHGLLSKPGSKEKAITQLLSLSGKTHHLITAVCIWHQQQSLWRYVETVALTMHRLSDEQIKRYVDLDEPLDSCGGYYFERHGHQLFSNVEGSKEAILGLPTQPLIAYLERGT